LNYEHFLKFLPVTDQNDYKLGALWRRNAALRPEIKEPDQLLRKAQIAVQNQQKENKNQLRYHAAITLPQCRGQARLSAEHPNLGGSWETWEQLRDLIGVSS
jgi:hypothetical protein